MLNTSKQKVDLVVYGKWFALFEITKKKRQKRHKIVVQILNYHQFIYLQGVRTKTKPQHSTNSSIKLTLFLEPQLNDSVVDNVHMIPFAL